ncbi:TetR/AcrR family transcriptional regulator [Streptomyces tubercidicus]
MSDTNSADPPGEKTWKGLTATERRTQRRTQLITAGCELLGTLGAAEVGARSVCRRAGLTERYFYESFGSREDLIAAVVEQTAAERFARMDEARSRAVAAGADPLEPMVRAYLDYFTEDPRRSRILLLEAEGEGLVKDQRERDRARTAALFSTLLTPAGKTDASDAALNAAALVGSQAELVVRWLDGRLRVSKERLIRHMVGVFRAVQEVSSQRGSATSA